MSFQANATAAERSLAAWLFEIGNYHTLPPAYWDWRDEIAARRPVAQTTRTVEASAVTPQHCARMTAPWRTEWYPPQAAIARRVAARLRARQPAPTPRSYSHWGMFDDA